MKKKIVVIMAILFIHNTVYGSTLSDKLVKNIIENNKVIDYYNGWKSRYWNK